MSIVPMNGLPDVLDTKHAALLLYWSSLRVSDQSPPQRQDLDPTSIPNLLPYLWMCEREEDTGRFICRLAGEHTRVRYGSSLRRTYLNEFIRPEDFDSVNGQFNAILDEPAIGFCHGFEHAADDIIVRFRGIVTPLSDGEKAKFVFGLSLYEEQYKPAKDTNLSHIRTLTVSSLWPPIGAQIEQFMETA